MNLMGWQKMLETQRKNHGKVLFSATELANMAGVSRPVLNVELSRLRRQGVVVQYAHGYHGLPDAVTPEALVGAMDSHAYITGSYALYRHNRITQIPKRITCFTDRYSPRGRERNTPLGRFVFTCVRSRVYVPPADGLISPPAQALADWVYLLRREGLSSAGLATFRALSDLATPELDTLLLRYPSTVRQEVRALVGETQVRRR
ncbi:MAG: hypothetical protein A2498_15485 [Lentisphaerae bacterium RIFOXYC12_FULL_60_16]|nr:MAG: hypothetical protein A2498_15485 [Lentisphaerae bacterium RIFOXYC12_FULL_60_16]